MSLKSPSSMNNDATTSASAGKDQLLETLQRSKHAFRIYNRFKIRHARQAFTSPHEAAFKLIPYFLYAPVPEEFGLVDGVVAPHGIYDYRYDNAVRLHGRGLFKKKSDLEFRNMVEQPAIQFLSLMGSLGSVAYTDKSDFDYWCCVDEELDPKQIARLEEKCRRIEPWCQKKLGVEVHFFITTAARLRNNDFGTVSKESCGSALAKLLKEEYFRGSIHIAGKIPSWWMTPIDMPEQHYARLIETLARNPKTRDPEIIDIGNIQSIPMEEMIGGGLWQINKGMDSPFKSALKLALLLEYSDTSSRNYHKFPLLATELKFHVQTRPNDMERLDPYQFMVNRIFDYYARRGEPENLETLRTCFFLKVKPHVSRWLKSSQTPTHFVDTIMLEYCRQWGWDYAKIEDLEHFSEQPLSFVLQWKNRIERFMLDGIKDLQQQCSRQNLDQIVERGDFTRLSLRLKSYYGLNRQRCEKFYPPYDGFIRSDIYTLRHVPASGEEAMGWELYRGRVGVDVESRKVDHFFLIHRDDDLPRLVMWMLNNDLLRNDTLLVTALPDGDKFTHNLRLLAKLMREHCGKVRVADLDSQAFASPSWPRKFICFANMLPGSDLVWSEERQQVETVEKYHENTRIFDLAGSAIDGAEVGDMDEAEEDELTRIIVEHHHDERVEILLGTMLGPRKEVHTQKTKTFSNLFPTLPTLPKSERDSQRRLLQNDDPLNAWDERVSLLSEAFLFEVNSWGELQMQRHRGPEWFGKVVSRVLNSCFRHELDPTEAFESLIGRWNYDLSMIAPRLRNLFSAIFQHFGKSAEQQRFHSGAEAHCPYFLFDFWGKSQVIWRENDSYRCAVYANLSRALCTISLQPMSRRQAGFDRIAPYGRSYSLLLKIAQPGQLNVFVYESHGKIVILIIDECLNLLPLTLPMSEMRVFLPRLVHSLQSCIADTLRSNPRSLLSAMAQPLSLRWVNWSENGLPNLTDFTSKALHVVNAGVSRMADTRFSLDDRSARAFLRTVCTHNRFNFPNEDVQQRFFELADYLAALRGGEKRDLIYRAFITGIRLEEDAGEPRSSLYRLYLKTYIEEALGLYLSGDAQAHPDGGIARPKIDKSVNQN